MNDSTIAPQRIVHLVPGTGHYHCGSCLRDLALASALRRRGHDATIHPLYLPLHTEGDETERNTPVFLGGINLDLRYRYRWFRRLPRWLTRVLDSPRLLRAVSHKAEMTQARALGEMTVEMLRGSYGSLADEIRRLGEHLATHDQPKVILLSNVMLISLAEELKRSTGARIVCTMQGEIPFLDALPSPYRERAWSALTKLADDVDLFVGVSDWYGQCMAQRLGVASDRWQVVHNGIDAEAFQMRSPHTRASGLTIGYLARLCEDKGLRTLFEAFFELCDRPGMENVRLRAAGVMLGRDKVLVDELMRSAESKGCADRITIEPNISLEEKVALLHDLKVLSVPATYGESFGLYVIEAHACGVPVVQPRHGAFTEIVKLSGGGVLCEPDDPKSLADGLERVLADETFRSELSQCATQSVNEHFSSDVMARRFEEACMIGADQSRTNKEAKTQFTQETMSSADAL